MRAADVRRGEDEAGPMRQRIGFIVIAAMLALGLAPLAASSQPAPPIEQGFSLDARVALNAYQALVEQELAGELVGLKVLAATEEARSGRWARIKGPLTAYSKGEPDAAAVFFARPDGSYFSVEKGLTGESLRDRDYFPGLMAGHDVEGVLVVSKSTGKKSVIVATPIWANGRVIGAFGVSTSVEKLAAQVDRQLGLPKDVVFYALDGQGRTALHRDSTLMFEFPSEMGSETLTDAVREMLSKPDGVVSYEFRGARKTVVFQASKATGWVFALGHATAASAP